MACWFNLPGGFFQIAFSIFGMWWWQNSDFFDVPVSPSFHYLGRTWSREEIELTILSSGHSCFPAPLPVAPFFLMSCPLSRSWRRGRAGRWPLLPGSSGFDSLSCQAEHFSWQNLGQGPPGVGPKHPLRPPCQGRDGLGRALAEMAAGHVTVSPSSAVLPFCNPASLTGQEPEVPPAENWDLDPKLVRLSSASLFSKQSLLSVSKFPFQFFLENPAANGFKCSVCV